MSRGRISSMWCNSSTLEAIDTVRAMAAEIVVRCREVIGRNLCLDSAGSFQIPALENEDGAAEYHGRIKQSVKRVLQDELPTDALLMRDRADDVQSREVRHEVCSTRGNPPGSPAGQGGEASQVVGKTPNHEQREREYGGKQRRRERRKQ